MNSDAIIHFVGLCVFTTQITGPVPAMSHTNQAHLRLATTTEEVVVIMPRVTTEGGVRVKLNTSAAASSSLAMRRLPDAPVEPKVPVEKAPAVPAAATMMQGPVETHTALLAFETSKFQSSSDDWVAIPLPNTPFSIVVLNNDHDVRFVVNGVNPVAQKPVSLGGIGGTLQPAYKPPAYSGAVAVFKIPKGELSVCVSQAAGVSLRRDTQLLLHNSGTVTIVSGSKSITLDGDAHIYALNVPMHYVMAHANGSAATSMGSNHLLAYCKMNGTEQNCTAPVLKPAGCTTPTPGGGPSQCPTCAQDQMITIIARASQYQPPASQKMAVAAAGTGPLGKPEMNSFECSNTQWP